MAENTSTSNYVKAPEAVPPEVPVEEQLGQLKIAAKGKIHEFVDKANQSANDPSSKKKVHMLLLVPDLVLLLAQNFFNVGTTEAY